MPPRIPKSKYERETASERNPPTGFDVTCSIGRVEFNSDSDLSPTQAAFLLIEGHGANGTFRFPNEDGSIAVITVDTETEQNVVN